MEFLSKTHDENFFKMLEQGHISINDRERTSFFYIISGNEDLYSQVNKIYDFNKNSIKALRNDKEEICFDNLYLSVGGDALLNLAVQLYNNQTQQTVIQTFSNLDEYNGKLALESIRIRFDIY